jgi:hypothetical protein
LWLRQLPCSLLNRKDVDVGFYTFVQNAPEGFS